MGPVDPTRMKPVSHGSIGRWRVGRVGSGQEVLKTLRVGLGQRVLKSHGSGRMGSRGFQISRVGSGRVKKISKSRGSGPVRSTHLKFFAGRVGSADPTRPDP